MNVVFATFTMFAAATASPVVITPSPVERRVLSPVAPRTTSEFVMSATFWFKIVVEDVSLFPQSPVQRLGAAGNEKMSRKSRLPIEPSILLKRRKKPLEFMMLRFEIFKMSAVAIAFPVEIDEPEPPLPVFSPVSASISASFVVVALLLFSTSSVIDPAVVDLYG